MVDESETLPLLQGDATARAGRRASRVLAAAAAATLVALSALALTSTVPRAARRTAFPSKDGSAPLAGTSGTYGWSCKDCSGGSAGSLTWSCNCRDKSQVYRGTSTVLKWTCQTGTDVYIGTNDDAELWNDNGCLQCKAYNSAWEDAKAILGYDDLCMAISTDYIASLFKFD